MLRGVAKVAMRLKFCSAKAGSAAQIASAEVNPACLRRMKPFLVRVQVRSSNGNAA
jgi:hypothetical protein